METVLTRSQKKEFKKEYTENGVKKVIIVTVRHDDQCGNGHNTFSITGEIWRKSTYTLHVNSGGEKGDCESCGQITDEIKKHFPRLAPLMKWHLTSTDGPMHYIANSLYHAGHGEYSQFNGDHFRSTAIWPEITDEQIKAMSADELRAVLESRFPVIMEEFRAAVEHFGFVY